MVEADIFMRWSGGPGCSFSEGFPGFARRDGQVKLRVGLVVMQVLYGIEYCLAAPAAHHALMRIKLLLAYPEACVALGALG